MKIRRIPKKRRIVFQYDDERVEIEYNLKNTAAKFKEVEDLMRSKDEEIATQAMIDLLAASVTSWNITDEQNKKLPINAETMEEFLTDFLFLACEEIGKDLNKFVDSFPKPGKR